MGETAARHGLYLQTCGTNGDYSRYGIHPSGCMTLEAIGAANGVRFRNLKHKGMREGCHCIESRDLGAYDTCLNGCEYCYANKRPDIAAKNCRLHDPASPLLLGHLRDTDVLTRPHRRASSRRARPGRAARRRTVGRRRRIGGDDGNQDRGGEVHPLEVEPAGVRLLGQPVCRLFARVPVLLCQLHEAASPGHDEPWGQFVDVKRWKPLKNARKHDGQQVFVGSVCDPYMPEEAEYGRTRALLEELVGSGMEVSIQTKSDLVLRDIDLISQLPGRARGLRINTLDEGFRSDMDAAVPLARRLAAMKELHNAGIRTTCFISPTFPGITDAPAIIEAARDRCNLVWLENLNLRGGYKADILGLHRREAPRAGAALRRHLPEGRPDVLAGARRGGARLRRSREPGVRPRRRHHAAPLRRAADDRELLLPRGSEEVCEEGAGPCLSFPRWRRCAACWSRSSQALLPGASKGTR